MALKHLNCDVAVIGGGAAGVGAAIAAAKNGARTILVEAGPIFGGELLSGMSVDGVLNGRGEWVVRGVADEIFEECRKMDGFIGPLHDYRLICYVCVDPEIMKIAIARVLARYDVTPVLYTQATDVVTEDGRRQIGRPHPQEPAHAAFRQVFHRRLGRRRRRR